ncbi:MAG: hypothetical protein HQM08_01030 [Candidatus Riflebacteria bacterium]|nr:hypothetical protein [Candidatus Riflebacteria bacterium]
MICKSFKTFIFKAALYLGLFIFSFVLQDMLGQNINPCPTMDSEYYQAIAQRLNEGKGFTESFIWQHLKKYDNLEHPTDYWMPLGSLIIAFFQRFFGMRSAIAFNYLIWSLCAVLIFRIVKKKVSGELLGFLAFLIFSSAGKFSYYLSTLDNIAYYSLFGLIFFQTLKSQKPSAVIINGISSGLLALTRAEGVFFTAFAVLHKVFYGNIKITILSIFCICLVFCPWLIRNQILLGQPFPTTQKSYFLQNYNDMFNPYSPTVAENFQKLGFTTFAKKFLRTASIGNMEMFVIPMFLLFFPIYFLGAFKVGEKGTLFLQMFFIFILSFFFPAQCERGTIFHLSSAFFGQMLVISFQGIAFFLPKTFSNMNKLVFFTTFFLITSWILFFTVIGNQTSQLQNSMNFRSLSEFSKELKAGLVPPVASFDPIAIYLSTGFPGVVIPIPSTEDRFLNVVKEFKCRSFLWDTLYHSWDDAYAKALGWKVTASFSNLVILKP